MRDSIDHFNIFFRVRIFVVGYKYQKGVIWWGTGLRFVCSARGSTRSARLRLLCIDPYLLVLHAKDEGGELVVVLETSHEDVVLPLFFLPRKHYSVDVVVPFLVLG